MTTFDGARIEFCEDGWAGDGKVALTLAVRGRTAQGRWLTEADARCSLAGLEDVELLAENCGCLFVSEDGRQEATDLLAAAFPGAGIHCYELGEEAGRALEATGASPLWECDVTWEPCENCP
ncbi:hypothetical protein [Streptomyces sp. NPDC101150]|uniref:hypothetical protein n=1 Tax=Streptomyces sp. NPDC101150 TaxID=3366114 RepID=UPI003815A8C4